LEDLKSRLTMIQDAEIQEIIDDAKSQAKRLIDEAHIKADETRKKETEKILIDRRETEKRQIESARFEGKKKIANIKFKLIEMALAEASKRLTTLAEKQDPTYNESLRKLIIEAGKAVTGQELELVANKKDSTFLKPKLKGIEKEISAAKGSPVSLRINEERPLSTAGIILRTVGGKEIFNNTIEARMTRARQELLVKISQTLFEGTKR